jgi:hypothetical protein
MLYVLSCFLEDLTVMIIASTGSPMIAPLKFPDLRLRLYSCRQCGVPVAHGDQEIQILGRPACTTYTNPLGIACTIVTFSTATNLNEAPDATTEDTWFEGYGWRSVACASCGAHLGWRYEATDPGLSPRAFYGLLVLALRELRSAP